jgi:cytoskeletal protein RodZ
MADPTIRMPGCQSCGTIASHGESFCRNCGKPLLAPTVAAAPPPLRQSPPPQSTITAVSPAAPVGMPMQQPAPLNVGRKRRSPLLLGCLAFLALIVVIIGAGGIYIWRSASYSPPNRETPAIPERATGTMTEFPVDSDPSAPASPTSVQTEALGGTIAKSSTDSTTKLPPGIDRSKLAKGATSMTSSTYKPKQKNATTAAAGPGVYICVLKTMPNQPTFGNGLATSIVDATRGQQTGVRVQSPTGAVYVGSKIRSAEANVYVLTKQGADVVILIYSEDPANQTLVDRLAQNVGNGQGLIDYPEVKDSLWTLPATTPAGLTLVDINTISGAEIENSISQSSGGGDDVQRILSQMRSFIPARLTGAKYVDSGKREWMTLNFQYESTFQAWKTWLLARSALGLGGAQSTTVRDVTGVYLEQEGMQILVFQKGPYLIFLTGPSGTPMDRLVNLGNQFQV